MTMLNVNGGTNDLTERARYYERCLGRFSEAIAGKPRQPNVGLRPLKCQGP
jgi:hypothetical protein